MELDSSVRVCMCSALIRKREYMCVIVIVMCVSVIIIIVDLNLRKNYP